jgi:DNA end-binding protein Ku
MRAIWKGAVSFGLVSVPVKLYAATESHDISFRQVHAKDGGRIKYQRVCSVDGEEVAYADIAKGYETEDGQMVVLDDDDLAELPASSSREISVEKFVPSDQIDPMWLEKSYYLEPDKAAAKPYALLREALKEADRMAVVTVSIRTRMTTAVLRVRDDVIVMQTMLWPDEVRRPEFAGLSATEHAATPNELKMAKLLVDTLAGDYDADDYEDDYQKAVEALVQAKLEGGEVQAPEQPKKSTGEVVDLLAALQRSVEAAKTARGDTTSGGESGGESDGAAAGSDAGERPSADAADDGASQNEEADEPATASKRATSGTRSARASGKKADDATTGTQATKKPAAKKATKSTKTKTTAKKAAAKKAS